MERFHPIRTISGILLLFWLTSTTFSQERSGDSTKAKRPPHGKQDPSSPLGINLSFVNDWTLQWPFIDAFKISRDWVPLRVNDNTWDTGEKIELTPEGWVARLQPEQIAATLVFTDTHGRYPKGEYLFLHEGEGSVEFEGDATVKSKVPGRIVLNVSPEMGFRIMLTQTNPRNPLRKIRLIMPGFEKTYEKELFHPLFLERLSMFKTLRFMLWGRNLSTDLASWSNRAMPKDARQTTEKGVAPEYMIQLANTLSADAWFCMPYLADDEFVRQFAKLVEEKLDPKVKVYVEYSNEVWNGTYPQHEYARKRGIELGLSEDPFEAALRFYSRRSVEIFKIWEGVFKDRKRLVRLLATQSGNPWVGTTILDWKQAFKSADALATAPYFGGGFGDPENQEKVSSWSVEKLLEGCEKDIDEVMKVEAENHANAKSRGLQLIAYEGGQHLVGVGEAQDSEKLRSLFHSANRDPRMKDLYLRYYRAWKSLGGGMFMTFDYVNKMTQYGSWGLLEYQDQPRKEAPKYDATLEFIETYRGR